MLLFVNSMQAFVVNPTFILFSRGCAQLWQLTKSKERVDEVNSVSAAVCSHCCLLVEMFLNGAALNYTAAVSSLGVLSNFTASECGTVQLLLENKLRTRILDVAVHVLMAHHDDELLAEHALVVIHNIAVGSSSHPAEVSPQLMLQLQKALNWTLLLQTNTKTWSENPKIRPIMDSLLGSLKASPLLAEIGRASCRERV